MVNAEDEPQQAAPPEEPPNSIAAQVMAVLAAGMAAHATVEALGVILAPLGLSRAAVRAAWRLMKYSRSPRGIRVRGEAGRRVARSAPIYRAMYLINAARRLQAGRRTGEDPGRAVQRERTYLRGHLRAVADRYRSAAEVDHIAQVSRRMGGGATFRWIYVSEPGTPCPRIRGRNCRDLHRKVFPVSSPPDGTYPGMRHHGCKCRASPVSGHDVYQDLGM